MVTELSKKAIYENTRIAVSQDEWSERNNSYLGRHRNTTERVAELKKLKCERQSKFLMLEALKRVLNHARWFWRNSTISLGVVAVEKDKVMPDSRLVFSFKDGTEIEA